ncbi:hypothetical protein [Radiobacillus sp. PE A8.2]|uniref:hypothetical protein n=1 Tax=Radiobacillus sp. PE A8.2 TaxID=3380349 RepID=UPI0038910AA3
MKKLLTITLVLVITLLGACSEAPSSKPEFGKTYDVNEGEAFDIVGKDGANGEVFTANVTISNIEFVENVSDNENYSFITYDLIINNTSDVEILSGYFGSANFNVYDENGTEVYAVVGSLGDYKSANIRPEGSNSGKMSLMFDKGEKPAQLIYSSYFLNKDTGNEYVIDLQ